MAPLTRHGIILCKCQHTPLWGVILRWSKIIYENPSAGGNGQILSEKKTLDNPLALPAAICWRDGPPLVAWAALRCCSEPICSVSCYSCESGFLRCQDGFGRRDGAFGSSKSGSCGDASVLGGVGPLAAPLGALQIYKIMCMFEWFISLCFVQSFIVTT